MGWTSTADVYSSTADANSGLTFPTWEAAHRFCTHNGWEVTDVRPSIHRGPARSVGAVVVENSCHANGYADARNRRGVV